MKKILAILIICTGLCLLYISIAFCQYWTALPPYNTLWPLWSPILSPLDPATGLNTPIVGSLTSATELPLQPGLTWNPALPYPWLLYNSPVGMLYYDAMFGLNAWPPSSLINLMTGAPSPLLLPTGYGGLPPTDTAWILNTIPGANSLYTTSYPYFAYIGTLSLPLTVNLPPINALNIASYLAMLPVPPVFAPPVLSASAILGL
ncbi:MAG: hypothetical protein ACMUIL_12870 [bacterium]